ncbi:MAG: putative oxidoreductase [Acidimicrobiia bacterium]|nr:putative oxidoreductase [Acidimicrobiia bacterium]
MTGHEPMRFSIQMPNAPDLATWTAKVRRAESHGFYSVSVPDHLGPSLPQLAPLVALAAAAAVTSTVRLAVTVLDNDFRHPVMLAKEIATLDLLSNGRVDMGLGAGWLEQDYTLTGVAAWDPPGRRVDRLIESIALMRQLLSGDIVNFSGDHYNVTDFQSYPRPVQSPIPLMIGGGGQRMLTMAAQQANIISILVKMNGPFDARRASFEQQLSWITDASAHRRDEVTLGIRVLFGEVAPAGQSRRQVADRIAAEHGTDAHEVLESPFWLAGDLPGIKDHLLDMRSRYGLSYFTVSEDLAWQIAPLVEELAAS